MNPVISETSPAVPLRRYSAKRTRHHVDFFCHAPEAENVWLVGDFNDWQPTANRMQWMPDGQWTASLELHHGHHHCLFVVNGTPTPDPNAHGTAWNENGERVSLIAVS